MEDLWGTFGEGSPVEAISIMEILRVYSVLDGFDIRNISIISSHRANCTLLRQCLEENRPEICQMEAGAHLII